MKTEESNKTFSKWQMMTIMSALLLLAGTTLFAQEMEKVKITAEVEGFDKWDADADQQWNQEEFDSFIGDVGLYGDWDRNYDGIYDDDELYTGFLYRWDKNGDDFISKDEYATGNTEWEREYADSFEEWDVNRDNLLDLEEYAAAMNQTGVFAGWDANNDGSYNEAEVNKGLFDYYDSNDDGFISDKEYDEVKYHPDYEKGYENRFGEEKEELNPVNE